MTQSLLFPDPRPLVERFGAAFFRQAPQGPGVYLMRDALDTVLYVGKAKNLRKRLTSYRVANPDRMRQRHLRLLRAVTRIELQECADEKTALARESELLLHLRPRFNRLGTWSGPVRFLALRVTQTTIELVVTQTVTDPEWEYRGPLGSSAFHLRAALARLLWCAVGFGRGFTEIPAGWISGTFGETATIMHREVAASAAAELRTRLTSLIAGRADEFGAWIVQRTARFTHPFELAVIQADLDTVSEAIGEV